MDLDFLTTLRRNHPAWRLLAADSAPFVIACLHDAFLRPNVRVLREDELVARLDDHLFRRRERADGDAPTRGAREYLVDWADAGWLRRYYPDSGGDSDEPHLDLTPAAERAIQWLAGLQDRRFVGAESRLRIVFDLLRQVVEGSETDPRVRIAELERRRAEIDAEIERVRGGRIAVMDPTQLRERFAQAVDTARALLADFRQVEQNFRDLDRQVRERITTAAGRKGDVLADVFGERDAIVESDQGRSFHAFWDLLMSPDRQEELSLLLERALALEAIAETRPDPRLRRIHYDWLGAGEMTQRTVARLSQELRRYLDDQAWFENRRIMSVIHAVEQHALALRDAPPADLATTLDAPAPAVTLPMERPLFSPPVKPLILQHELERGEVELDTGVLFEQFHVDETRLRSRLRRALQARRQIGLRELLADEPLEQGLSELVAWLRLATDERLGVVDDERTELVRWRDADGRERRATVPVIVFVAPRRSPAEACE